MFTFTVEPDNGDPYEVTAKSRDLVRWEKLGGGRSLGKFEHNASMAWITEIAHVASVRQGLYSGSRDSFLTEVDVALHQQKKPAPDGEGESDPTQPAL
jgi:hypothetical protein